MFVSETARQSKQTHHILFFFQNSVQKNKSNLSLKLCAQVNIFFLIKDNEITTRSYQHDLFASPTNTPLVRNHIRLINIRTEWFGIYSHYWFLWFFDYRSSREGFCGKGKSWQWLEKYDQLLHMVDYFQKRSFFNQTVDNFWRDLFEISIQ